MSGALVVVIGFVVWAGFAVWLGIVLGRVIKRRNRQVPPSHSDDEDES